MANLADAAKRRTAGTAKKPEEKAPNLSKIQTLIDESASGTFDEQPEAPQQMGDYNGPGAPQLHEALAKARMGVDEPGPPPDVVRRMQRERILPFLTPDIADMAARYGVIPPAGPGADNGLGAIAGNPTGGAGGIDPGAAMGGQGSLYGETDPGVPVQ